MQIKIFFFKILSKIHIILLFFLLINCCQNNNKVSPEKMSVEKASTFHNDDIRSVYDKLQSYLNDTILHIDFYNDDAFKALYYKLLTYSDDAKTIRNLYNDREDLSDDEIIDFYSKDIYKSLYYIYLWRFPHFWNMPGFYIDTINQKYIKILLMDDWETLPRLELIIDSKLEQITDQEEKYRFIHDSLITVYELFPKKKKLNYSYDEISKLKYLDCFDGYIEKEYYFKNDSIAKSQYIKPLGTNKWY